MNNDSSYYEGKLADIGNNRTIKRTDYSQHSTTPLPLSFITQISERFYLVKSQTEEDVFYNIDMQSNICECLRGRSKGVCRHKLSVNHHFNVSQFASLPTVDPLSRGLYHYIAFGRVLDNNLYRGLRDTNVEAPPVNQHIEQHILPDEDVEMGDTDVVQVPVEHLNNSDNHDDNNGSNTDNKQQSWEEFLELVTLAQDKHEQYWPNPNFQIAFTSFKKKFKKAFKGKENTLVRKLHDFGIDKKKNNSHLILVQTTAVARRVNDYKGRGRSTAGRRPKKSAQKTQMFLGENDEGGSIFHSAPYSVRKSVQPHSLKTAVAANRPNAKKH